MATRATAVVSVIADDGRTGLGLIGFTIWMRYEQ